MSGLETSWTLGPAPAAHGSSLIRAPPFHPRHGYLNLAAALQCRRERALTLGGAGAGREWKVWNSFPTILTTRIWLASSIPSGVPFFAPARPTAKGGTEVFSVS